MDKKISELKSKVITRIMLGVRGFNEKHRGLARVTTVLALILIVLLSVLFTIAEKICSVFGDTGVFGKRALGIILAVLLLFVTSIVGNFISPVVETIELDIPQSKVTEATAELSEVSGESNVAEPEQKPEEPEQKSQESEQKPEEPEQKSEEAKTTATTESAKSSADKEWNTADIDIKSLMKEYPETVGWIFFEDGHISYPIMQSSDNAKYKTRDYKGDEVREGSIFLDHKSAPDFTDANSIIYGHNMKDGTMFGSLREYRDTPGYYNDHQYFQIILPDKIYRYQIFAYMDVPQSYVLYDYVGEASGKLGENLEAVRLKAYIGDELPVNASDKVVTLSTCTDKDRLQFVILGVLVDETE